MEKREKPLRYEVMHAEKPGILRKFYNRLSNIPRDSKTRYSAVEDSGKISLATLIGFSAVTAGALLFNPQNRISTAIHETAIQPTAQKIVLPEPIKAEEIERTTREEEMGKAYPSKKKSPDNSVSERKQKGLKEYVDAVIEIESNGNPRASRFEPDINDTSYGLGQLLTGTARAIEKKHPELPRLGKDIKKSLCNPKINGAYTKALFKEELRCYGNPFLAVAAYNSGHLTPKLARDQEQLNDIYGTNLITDGRIGKLSQKVVKRFQREYGLGVDGKIGKQTSSAIDRVWQNKFSGKQDVRGITPINKYTPNHVEKFRNALKSK